MSNISNSDKIEYDSIPLITDVVVLGNPEMKRLAEQESNTYNHAAINFQNRIDGVEDAIGQNEEKSPARAHAIRAEAATS